MKAFLSAVMILFGFKIHGRLCSHQRHVTTPTPRPHPLFKACHLKTEDVWQSQLVLLQDLIGIVVWLLVSPTKTKAQRGRASHLSARQDYKCGAGSQQPAVPSPHSDHPVTEDFSQTVKMQSAAAFGFSVRHYAAAPLFPLQQNTGRSSPVKPTSGKSFTIDALLSRGEDSNGRTSRTSPTECGLSFPPGAPLLPLGAHLGSNSAPGPFLYSPNLPHSAVHTQPGYSLYCCPNFSYPSYPSCRGAFYPQGKNEPPCRLILEVSVWFHWTFPATVSYFI